jgi:cytoskeletal protein CcmA (bactofilin family)
VWRTNGNTPIPEQNSNSTSILDQSSEFDGRLRFTGTLVVNGKFRGEILSSGTLLAAETAELEADVRVGTAIVSGRVTGNIFAAERVELRAGARIEGDITTPALVLEEGVMFDGNCKMTTGEVAAVLKSS